MDDTNEMFNKKTNWKQIVRDLWEKVDYELDDPCIGITYSITGIGEEFYNLDDIIYYLIKKYSKDKKEEV